MVRFTTGSVVCLLALALLPSAVYAQAAITGVVKDDSGAVLPGVNGRGLEPRADRKGSIGYQRRYRPVPDRRFAPGRLLGHVHAAWFQHGAS